jgi:hypothetical protein
MHGWTRSFKEVHIIVRVQTAVHNASFLHGEFLACHFDGIVRLLCVNDQLRQHLKVENNSTTLAARQAAIAAATALAE